MQFSQAEMDLMRYGTDGGGSVHDVDDEETCDGCGLAEDECECFFCPKCTFLDSECECEVE